MEQSNKFFFSLKEVILMLNDTNQFTAAMHDIFCFTSALQCTESGVVYLESMLSVRSPLDVDEYENTKDSGMVKFLQEGRWRYNRYGDTGSNLHAVKMI